MASLGSLYNTTTYMPHSPKTTPKRGRSGLIEGQNFDLYFKNGTQFVTKPKARFRRDPVGSVDTDTQNRYPSANSFNFRYSDHDLFLEEQIIIQKTKKLDQLAS